ncbi:MAG: ABC transporter ATP-binding protein [Kofleriaceae bacterium]|nr:ABC transporter ATP-binding protein [Kofleriaceae bacterium]MBP9167593.1 ABC transporter ATP-binding protein [Kofleriaceae bacterium]MBP9856675.1 ABC transporter ATP-binding protein [Kofleriaceae bacterium]
MLELRDVTFGYDARPVVRAASLAVARGELVALVGPNGAGKTTLARVAAGLIAPHQGTARVGAVDPARAPRRELARTLAYLPQRYELAFPFTALEVVLMGRYARQRGPGLDGAADEAAARAALARCDVGALAERRFDALSGGERRRVVLAQALCQGADALLLDEPTAALDPAHAIAVAQALADERARGAAILIVTHDLDLAARFADRIVAMADGAIVADGPPSTILADPAVQRAFAVTFHVGALADGSRFVVAR